MFEGKNVHFSTDNKPLCSFSAKLCNLRRLNGYAFCVRHILEDSAAPFKQCAFVVKTSGQQCTSAIPAHHDRQYCNAHMQVLGIIPKKERKQKKPLGPGEMEQTATPYLERFSNNQLLNGIHDVHKPQHAFSASKMFPELAGKLSCDNQPKIDPNSSLPVASVNVTPPSTAPVELSSTAPQTSEKSPKKAPIKIIKEPSRNGLNGLHASAVVADWFDSISPTKSSQNCSSKKRKSTKKQMSVLRKKRMGLLSELEARDNLSAAGYKAYSLYAMRKSYSADLLTNAVDSSDDEYDSMSVLWATSRQVQPHEDSYQSRFSCCLDHACLGPEKRSCISLKAGLSINATNAEFGKKYLQCLIDTVRDDLACAAYLLRKIRHIKTEKASPIGCQHRALPDRRRCMYQDEQRKKRCIRYTVPFANHCINHIMYNVDQQLFEYCTYTDPVSGSQCCRPVSDNYHVMPVCSGHGYFENNITTEPETIHKKNRRKPKPFALLRPSKKKKRKSLQPHKPISCQPSSTDAFADKSPTYQQSEKPKPDNEDLDSPLIATLDKTLELPLDQADSKLLDDQEIQQVLNKLPDDTFDLFSEYDGDLVLNAHAEEEESELPAHITDTILNVESEQRKAAALKTQQQQQHINYVTQQHYQPQPTYSYSTMDASYSDNDYRSGMCDQGPPPEYPGKITVNHGNYIQLHQNYHHKMLSHHSIPHPPPRHPQLAAGMRVPLPSSDTLLPTQHVMTGRLPPVATIAMQQWQGDTAPYQNGYSHHHMPMEPHYTDFVFHPNGLPSPPLYHTRPHRPQMYAPQGYTNGTYHLSHQPPHHQHQPHIDMPL